MSLQEVIDTWRSGGDQHDAARADKALAVLKRRYAQVVTNINTDKQITKTQRADLLRQLISVDVNEEALVTGAFIRFCDGNVFHGTRQKSAEQAVLGHTETLNDFEASMKSSAAPHHPATRRRRPAISVTADLEGRTVAEQKALLRSQPLRQWMTWSCYQSRYLDEPFYGVTMTKAEVRNRLGLGEMAAHEPIVIWGHRLRDGQKAYRPTAFDAKAYEWFRPGGKTAPLDGSPDALREVVHGAIYADQLEQAIEVLR